MDKVENFFDNMYKSTKGRRFSRKPRRHINLIPGIQGKIKGLTLLEIGAGEAQNAIYLSQKGYKGTATDISTEALRRVQKYAAECKVKLGTSKLDTRNGNIRGKYDCVILTLVFHNLKDKERYVTVKKIMNATKNNGINFISFYTEREDRKEFPGLEEGILKLYKQSKWSTVRLFRDRSKLQNKKSCKITTIIVRKPTA